MPKGSDKREHGKKKPKLSLIEKRQRKREKKFNKEHPISDAREVFEE